MPTQSGHQNLKAVSGTKTIAYRASMNPHEQEQFKFHCCNRLQSSLDLHEVLAMFYQLLHSAVPAVGMLYHYPKKNIRLQLGCARPHSANYNLKIANHSLGGITFYRSQRFDEHELLIIETLLGLLVQPLRNAILYRNALENSLRDSLTGIGNRNALESTLAREFKIAQRAEQSLSLLIADIDFFKRINDNAGHQCGDRLIKKAAMAIQNALRQTDEVFRYGGEEFVVVLSDTQHLDALMVAERIRVAMEKIKMESKAGVLSATMSLGVSTLRDGDTRDALFERADSALYRAKAAGRNCIISAERFTSLSETGSGA